MRLVILLLLFNFCTLQVFASQTSGTWTLAADETLTGEIELTGDLTVNGGGYTLTAATGKRLFKTGSHKLVLNNVKLTGGDPSGATTDCGGGSTNSDGCSGGAVLVVGGTLEAKDSEFLSSKGHRGSAIFARNGATVTLTDCKVNNNENTKSNPNNYCYGGAIGTAQSTTKVHIIRGEVNNNDIKDHTNGCKSGGLVSDGGHFNVTGTTIKGNKGKDGGGIYIYGSSSLTLTDAIVENNTATSRGGGIHIYEAQGTITNTIIKNNEAKLEGGGIIVQGWGNKLTTITGSTIQDNKRKPSRGASNYDVGGAGICIGLGFTNYLVNVEIRQTTFKDNNDADGNGHHIFTKRSTSDKPVITLVNNEYLGATGNIIGGHEKNTDSATNFEAAKTCTDSPCSKDPFKGTCADLSDNKGVTCDCTSGTLEPSTYGASTCCGPTGCSASSSSTTCAANQHVVNKACVACPAGTTNAAGDDPTGADTTCDATLCAINERVVSNACTACPPGTTNAAGDDASGADTTCDATICGANLRVVNNDCVSCPPGTTNAAGDDASGADTTCDATLCAINEYVSGNVCKPCLSGRVNAAGDDASGADTVCDCGANLRVVNNDCVSCPQNTTNAAGDDISGADTYCDLDTPCGHNQFVNTNHQCEACSAGSYNDPGDRSVGTCDDTEKCLVGQHVKLTYPSDNTKKYGGTSCSNSSDCQTKCTANSGCAGYTDDGFNTVKAWGASTKGGTDPGTIDNLVNIFSNKNAFAALKKDGSVKVWGDSTKGGTDPSLTSGVVKIFSTDDAFAALKDDGSVKVWGSTSYGGTDPGLTSGVVDIFSTSRAFAALKDDGSVKVWGSSQSGGCDSGSGTTVYSCKPSGLTDVVNIFSNPEVFVAIKSDGSVKVWGKKNEGGTDPSIGAGTNCKYSTEGEYESGTNCAKKIAATDRAFAALISDGSIKTWGSTSYGGTDPGITSGAVDVFSSYGAFVVRKSDGSLKVWGSTYYGGTDPGITNGAGKIIPNQYAFALLKPDGSVKVWGDSSKGGADPGLASDVVDIIASTQAFAALKSDGTVKVWGREYNGGCDSGTNAAYSCKPSGLTDVVSITSTDYAFAALKSDGSIEAWGYFGYGGTDPSISSGVDSIYSSPHAFVAVSPLSRAYGPLITGTGNSFTKTKGCTQCPAGYSNDALDDPAGAETTCDFLPCAANHHVLNGACTQCPGTATRAAGDSDPTVNTYCTCGINQHVVSNVCTDCTSGTTRPAGDDSSGADTVCIIAPCAKDFRVKDNVCVACPQGMTNAAGDTNVNGDTYCDSTTLCDVNEYVSNHVCTACPAGTSAPYGSDPAGADTVCTCGKDQYSDGSTCQTCPYGTFNNAGDAPNVASTCDDVDVCEANEYVSSLFLLHEDKQLSNAAGYSDAITDFAKAKRLCIEDTNCKGLTKDASNNYYLSDGTLSANTAYDAYEINRTKFMCHTCPSGGTRAAGDVATAETQCTFDNCAVNQYVDDYECKACPTGKESAATNPSVGNSVCTTPPCAANEYVKIDYDLNYRDLVLASTFTNNCAKLADDSLKCWGREDRIGDGSTGTGNKGPTSVAVPTGRTIEQLVGVGDGSMFMLLDNGDVYAWGKNSKGQLGLGDTTKRYSPTKIDLGTDKVIEIGGTQQTTFLVMEDGSYKVAGDSSDNLYGWSYSGGDSNTFIAGQANFGTGRKINQICTTGTYGGKLVCALLDNGGIKCWGKNEDGGLGDGTAGSSTSKSVVNNYVTGIDGSTDAKTAIAVDCGKSNACAIMKSGSVKCWGDNHYGQLGDVSSGYTSGEDKDKSTPVDVNLAAGEKAVKLGLSDQTSCALLESGVTKCWGFNNHKAMGNGLNSLYYLDPSKSENKLNYPSTKKGVDIITGLYGGCVLLDDKKVRCWGYNANGQVGDSTTTSQKTPLEVPLGGDAALPVRTSFSKIAKNVCAACPAGSTNEAGDSPDDGASVCDWGTCGANEYVSSHVCTPCTTGTFNDAGDSQAADTTCDDLEMCDANEYGKTTLLSARLSGGGSHTCAILNDDTLKCFGWGARGQLGYGDTDFRGDAAGEMGDNLPVVDLGTGKIAKQVVAGNDRTCAILDDDTLKCWGGNSYGKLGYGDTDNRGDATGEMGDNLAAINLGTGKTAKQIAAGDDHTCAILNDDTLKCWGRNNNGELGYGDMNDRGDAAGEMGDNLAAINLGTGKTAKQVTAGTSHTCAILDDHTVKCWGSGGSGRLGYGDTTSYSSPPSETIDLGTGKTAKQIAAGDGHTCAILDDDTLKCWGTNHLGQLGIGSTTSKSSPQEVNLGTGKKVKQIAAGQDFTCALLDSGKIKCWGYGYYGRLGYGDTTDRGDAAGEMGDNLPLVNLGTDKTVKELTVGHRHGCAVLNDDTVKCWGYGASGRLGSGDTNNRGDGANEMGDNLPVVSLGTGKSVITKRIACAACPGAGTNAAARINETGTCTFPDCQTDQYSDGDGICKACPSGRTMPTPVNPSAASKCLCAENERVSGGSCTACPAGFTNAAGDDPASADTTCDFTPCAINHYVVGTGHSRVCTACTSGTYSPGGEVTACSSVEYCSIDQKVALAYLSDNTKKYGGTSCSNSSDCQTKCTANSTCAGYTTSKTRPLGAGVNHFCYLVDDGSVQCLGNNQYGQLGTGSTTAQSGFSTPSLGKSATAVDAGKWFSCAILVDKTIKCWGYNGNYNLGDGSTTNRYTPVTVSGYTDVEEIASADRTSCARLTDGSVKCWGYASQGLSTGTISLGGQAKILRGGGTGIMCVILTDNKLKCWGDNSNGQLGVGDSTDKTSPTEISFTGRYAVDVSCSYDHCCVALDDGNVRCSGTGIWGKLGYGNTNNRNTYGPNIDLPTGKKAVNVVCGMQNTYVIFSDGTATSWGLGYDRGWSASGNTGDASGEMGDNLSLIPFSTTVSFIDSYSVSRAAVLDDGKVIVWGNQASGELSTTSTSGYNSLTELSLGTNKKGALANSANYGPLITGTGTSFKKGKACTDCPEGFQNEHRNATRKDGPVNTCTVRNCVLNEYSDGSVCKACPQYTGAASAGLDPTSGATQCTAITCKTDERVVSNVCTACDSTSYRAPGDQIFGGDTHCFCKDNHKVINKACVACEAGSSNPNLCYSGLQDHYCICDANYHVVNKVCTACPAGATRPAGDYGGNGDTHCICGEDQHVVNNVCTPCAGGAKRPAGDDSGGADTSCSCKTNEHVKEGKISVLSAKHGNFNCAILNDDTVKCWGQGNYGQLGNGGTATRGDGTGEMGDNLVIANMGSGQTAKQIAAGAEHACALLDSGEIKCWGRGYKGQLGSGSTSSKYTPFGPVDLGTGKKAKQVAVGGATSCAILDDDTLKCWGYNFDGKLGLGDTNNRGDGANEMGDNLPVIDLGTGRTVKQVAIAKFHICAILDDDTLKCWGSGGAGKLGYGDTTSRGDGANEMGDNLPVVDLGTGKTVKKIAAGESYTCAILNDDTMKCWGQSYGGMLGYSGGGNRGDAANEMGDNLPVIDLGTGKTVKEIAAGKDHTCVILNDYTVKCWGTGGYGKLGYGSTTTLYVPPSSTVELGTGKTAKYIVAGKDHTCVGLDDDTVKCWGSNYQGQLGYGSTTSRGDGANEMGDNLGSVDLGTNKKLGSLEPKCSACPAGSVRAAGDFVADGVTSCACPEDFRVSGGQCVACVAGTRAAGDDPSAGDTHCACNANHKVVSNVCTACPAGQEKAAGDDASGADTSCLCKENYYSKGDGTCAACDTANGAVLAAGSDPAVASQCTCSAGYETSGATCSQCAATEESVAGEACKCKENHYYDGSACKACAPGSTNPAGDDKSATTACTTVQCAENEHVSNHVCVPCVSGMVRAAGDNATGVDTQCAYQGTSHVVSTSGNFVYKIDGGSNNGAITLRVGETHSFYRDSAGNPFRIVSEADCAGKDCDKAQYNALPDSSLGLEDAEQNKAVTVFAPTAAGLYYYMSTTNGYRKGRINAKWPLCVITYPTTTLTGSCELSSEVIITGDLTITFSLSARLRAQSGDVPQIIAASSARHFKVANGRKLTIENVDLSGGRGAEGGSILVEQGEIDINNVKFTNNIATGAGGAVRVKNSLSKVKMNNVLFDGNQGSEGGAISIKDSMAEKAEIHNSDFKNNIASTGDGGAIKADSVLNITVTNFEDNSAGRGEGGGISSTKDVTLTGSSFKRNKALRGGAMKSKDNKVDMSNMVIEANEASEEGGAFNAENAEFDVKSSTITANKAKKGAAFKSTSSSCTTNCKKLRIRSSSISDNEATSEGGAIDFGGDANAEPQFWVQDTSMSNNKAAGAVNNFKQRGSKVKIKAIDSDVGTVDGGSVDKTCATDQCAGRAHSTCEVTTKGTTCACDGTNRHLSGTECKTHKVCTGLGLDVQIRAPDKTHDRLCGTKEIAGLTYKLDDKGKELANMIEAKLVAEGVAADQAYALAVEVFGEINKCE